MRLPDSSFSVSDPNNWHYADVPQLARALEEHLKYRTLLMQHGVNIELHDSPLPGKADSIFVCDPVLMTKEGAIVLNMSKPQRKGEEGALADRLCGLGIPVYGRLNGHEHAEGGDLLWLDNKTLAVGCGFRTNRAGYQALQRLLEPLEVTLIPVHLPYSKGPLSCLHLGSVMSVIRRDLLLAYLPLLPVSFWNQLKSKGMRFISVDKQEFETAGANVLALSHQKCIAVEGNEKTRLKLHDEGIEVLTFKAEEICIKTEGGPTCLVNVIARGGE
jgi:N-dimethylarginine dimethylaminohydrolase